MTSPDREKLDALRKENGLLRAEIETARRAAEITAELVVEQISKMEDNYRELAKVNRELREAMEEIDILRGTLPICAHCKSIRDDGGYWSRIEEYLEQHASVDFTHGLCPKCEESLYGKEDWYQQRKKKR